MRSPTCFSLRTDTICSSWESICFLRKNASDQAHATNFELEIHTKWIMQTKPRLRDHKISYFYIMNFSTADTTKLKKYFEGRPIKRAYLFGSRSRNEERKGSDVDILVELDHSKPIGMKFFTFQLELQQLLKTKVDLVSTEGISKYVKIFVDRDMQLIYERGDDR